MQSMICRKTTIRVRKLVVQCFVGVHHKERASQQPVIFNLWLTLANAEVTADHIDATVDYKAVAAEICAMAGEHRCATLEELARRVGQLCLDREQLKAVRVQADKPNKVPDCAFVGVDRTFTRPKPSVQLAALVLHCADIEESKRFYGHLGFAFKAEQHGSKKPRHYASQKDGFLLELYPPKKGPGKKGAPVLARLTFRVGDLAAVAVQMPNKNLVREGLREGVVSYVDPDGRFVEIVQA